MMYPECIAGMLFCAVMKDNEVTFPMHVSMTQSGHSHKRCREVLFYNRLWTVDTQFEMFDSE